MKNMLKENERIDFLNEEGLKIIQNKNEFCFGIDSVLLSHFAEDISPGSEVVDLGTGTGIISILLASQEKIKKISAIEIQPQMCEMASRSVALNQLQNKIEIMNENIKELDKKLKKNYFDAIVTNPPYKKLNAGIRNKKESKLISRHEILCNLEDIIKISSKLLKDKGAVYMVHRPERLVDIMTIFRKYKIEPKILKFIYPKKNREPNLLLIKAVKNAGEFLKIEKPLIVYNEDGTYTDEILKIYHKSRE